MEQFMPPHDEDSVISDCESTVSVTATMPQEGPSLVKLPEGDVLHDVIKRRFIRGLRLLGPKAEVLSVHRNACADAVSQARLQSFQAHAKAVAKLREGNANVKYAWYGTSGEDDVNDIVSHGFTHVHGPHLLFAPDDNPLPIIRDCVIGKDGVRHILLCRVILGRSELVEDGTEQCYPSSQNYDSGVDSFSTPGTYKIWSNCMNTHVLPAYVISFRFMIPYCRIDKSEEELLKPTSPWIPIPALISALSNVLPPRDLALVSKFYKSKKENKISRHELIRRVRRITGDRLLVTIIKAYREKKKLRFVLTSSENGLARTLELRS